MRFGFNSTCIALIAAGAFALTSCGSGGGNKQVATIMQTYQAKPASTHLKGTIDGVDELHFVLFNDKQTDTMVVFSVANGLVDVILEKIPANEVYFLEIRGKAEGYEDQDAMWKEVVPLYAQDGSELELIAEHDETRNALSKRRFTIRGGGEEQDFLQSWFWAYTLKQDELEDQVTLELSATGRQLRQRNGGVNPKTALAAVDQEYIGQGKPLASTLFLISRQNDHRSKAEDYKQVLQNASPEALQGKYGVDLNNRLVRITQFSKQLDFEKLLASRDAKLANFDVKAYADKEYILIAFWASRYPQALEQLPQVEQLIGGNASSKFALVNMSLDQKMSAWKAASEKLDLKNSYMLRAEVRQLAIEELYLTDLPRYMIVKADGTVVENDVPFEELEAVISAL